MILGTHNSLTSYKLKGWLKIFSPFINLTSRCLTKTIKLQLDCGVRWFNLQINKYKGEWIGSHGIAWYDVKLFDVLEELNKRDDVYVQLYLDKHFGVNTSNEEFEELAQYCMNTYTNIKWQSIWNECTGKHIRRVQINGKDHYWTFAAAKKWYLKIPIPVLQNKAFKNINVDADYIMIDFV